MTFHKKLLQVENHCVLDLINQIDLLKIVMELDIQYYLTLKDMMQFMMELDIL